MMIRRWLERRRVPAAAPPRRPSPKQPVMRPARRDVEVSEQYIEITELLGSSPATVSALRDASQRGRRHQAKHSSV